MRVSSIDLYSNDNLVTTFDVNQRDVRNPYILKGITGLDADSIVPQFYGQGAESGSNFHDMALEPREIVMKIGLNPNYLIGHAASDLRGTLYRAIASSRKGTIQLRFNEDAATVGAITGFITKFEGPLNNKDPEVTITMRCDDPIFKSLYIASAIVSEFVSDTIVITDPTSTSPHGFKLKLTFDDTLFSFLMREQEIDPDWFFQIDYTFIAGDELYLSSEAGDKYAYRVRSAVTLQLMDLIVPGSMWPVMFPGENNYWISDTADITFNEWYWYETHWGV